MSKQTTNTEGMTVSCSGVIKGVKKRGFICPRNKRWFPFPGKKKCIGCSMALWTKEEVLKTLNIKA